MEHPYETPRTHQHARQAADHDSSGDYCFSALDGCMTKEPVSTLTIIHIFGGEEAVSAGDDGQTWVATFAHPHEVRSFIAYKKGECEWVFVERGVK